MTMIPTRTASLSHIPAFQILHGPGQGHEFTNGSEMLLASRDDSFPSKCRAPASEECEPVPSFQIGRSGPVATEMRTRRDGRNVPRPTLPPPQVQRSGVLSQESRQRERADVPCSLKAATVLSAGKQSKSKK
jgi:hypothetical protein